MEKNNEKLIEERKQALKNNEKVQKILQYKRQGLSNVEITQKSDIQLKDSQVSAYVIECIKLGLITEKELEEAKPKADEHKRQRKIQKLKANKKVQRILEYRELGMKYIDIAKMPDVQCVHSHVSQYMKECLELGIISQEYIEKAKEKEKEIDRQKRIKELKNNKTVQRILEYKKQGLSNSEISRMEDIKKVRSLVVGYIQECLQLGLISKEDIPISKINRKSLNDIEKDEEIDVRRIKQLKREIENEVKFYKKIPDKDKEKIREYLELSFKMNNKEPKSLLELEFIERAMQKIPITYNDIIRYVRQCNKASLYEQALKMIRQVETLPQLTIMPEERKKLNEVQPALIRINKVQNAINLIKEGNCNTEVLCEITGLSTDEINFLKIKVSGRTPNFLNFENREKVMQLLLAKRDSNQIKDKLRITDLEMEDIKEQYRYRTIIPEKRDAQAQIKQDSKIRIAVLYTKMGNNVQDIAKILKITPKEVEEDINLALGVKMIQTNQLNGIDVLQSQKRDLKLIER